MAGVRIFLQQGEKRYETISDAAGAYEFAGLPEGKYELTTDLPEHLSGHRETITIKGKGCVPVQLSVQASGEIGRRTCSRGLIVACARADMPTAIPKGTATISASR